MEDAEEKRQPKAFLDASFTCLTDHRRWWPLLKLRPCRWSESSASEDAENTPDPTERKKWRESPWRISIRPSESSYKDPPTAQSRNRFYQWPPTEFVEVRYGHLTPSGWSHPTIQLGGFSTSETVVARNSELSKVHPSKHCSVCRWLTLAEMLAASKCHCGSTNLRKTRGRKWCHRGTEQGGKSFQKGLPPAAVQSVPRRVPGDEGSQQLLLINLEQTAIFTRLNQLNQRSTGAGAGAHLKARQAVIGRQAVVGRQAAVVGGHPRDKVVQQVLTGHQQTGEADEGHVQPLVPPETSRLTMATRVDEKLLHICTTAFKGVSAEGISLTSSRSSLKPISWFTLLSFQWELYKIFTSIREFSHSQSLHQGKNVFRI